MLHDQRRDIGFAIDQIRTHHRDRMFAMNQRIRLENALSAFIRTQLGWQQALPEPERKKIEKAAKQLIKDGGGDFAEIVAASKAAAKPFVKIENMHVREMEKLAESLPVWDAFGAGIWCFGPASLATILGIAGDLSNYPTHSHLWKRCGLAVIDERRQGNPGPHASAEEWIRHGYSPRRRSLIYVIGAALVKRNGERDGRYRAVYDRRKAYELERGMPKGHAHNRAQRYMEKKLLRNLWNAWRVLHSANELGVGGHGRLADLGHSKSAPDA